MNAPLQFKSRLDRIPSSGASAEDIAHIRGQLTTILALSESAVRAYLQKIKENVEIGLVRQDWLDARYDDLRGVFAEIDAKLEAIEDRYNDA